MATEIAYPAPPAPPVRFSIGVTGHREGNGAFAANRVRIEVVLKEVLDLIAAAVAAETQRSDVAVATVRLHSLLSDGADQMAAEGALQRGWELVSPLPFGLNVNIAINALPVTAADARALLAGKPAPSVNVQARAEAIRHLAARSRLFELADRDEAIGRLLVAGLEFPDDPRKAATFAAESSLRVQHAARVMIDQSDIVIAIWDGVTRAFIGGTGHTTQLALETGAPVLWIDANAPDRWRILYGPEALAAVHMPYSGSAGRASELQGLVRAALRPAGARKPAHGHHPAAEALELERWRPHSNRTWHGYRRVEALFGAQTWKARLKSLRQTFETPDTIAAGSAAGLIESARGLPGQDEAFVNAIDRDVLRRFAWTDGVSSRLSDTYRGGMIANFVLAPLAIVGGIAYMVAATSQEKWIFASIELALLVGIVAITLVGQRRRWHGRWFETRRVAEYLRHAPILLLLGVARAPGRWPRGAETSWPEWYARRSLREIGLPRVAITQTYLRRALRELLDGHVTRQRDYHIYKAKRLAAAHHNLDRLSEVLFTLAVVSVSTYLVLKLGGTLGWWSKAIASDLSYMFTVLGVALPTFGAAIAGIRYFGDFERFSAISEVTAEKLTAIHLRISALLASPDAVLDYGQIADLAHAMDDTVVTEIESWQAVFGGKHVTVPV